MADGRERQVSGHQRLAVRRQLPQKTDPDAGRLLGVVFEAVVPVRVLEPDLEHGIAGERQPVAAGRKAAEAIAALKGERERQERAVHQAELKWDEEHRAALAEANRKAEAVRGHPERWAWKVASRPRHEDIDLA